MSDSGDDVKDPPAVEQMLQTRRRSRKAGRKRRRAPKEPQEGSSEIDTTMEMTRLDSPPPEESNGDSPHVSVAIPNGTKSEVEEEKEKKWHWTARVPGQILPTVVGPVGMGLVWKKMSTIWDNNSTLQTISLVILGWTVFQMTMLLLLMTYRLIRYPSISILEQKHPTHFIFGILVTLYPCLISSFILHWNQTVASVFWYIGIAAMCLYMVYSCHRFVVQKIPIAQMNAFYLFGPLPILLAVQLAPYAPKELLFFGWSAGTLWYLGLHVMLIFRYVHIGLPQPRDRAAMWLLIAASADSVLAYAAASENGFGEAAKFIFYFSLLQFGVLLTLSHKIFKTGFVSTWWMTTLPSTAFASSWLSYGVALDNQGVIITGTVLAGCATLWILILYVLTAVWIIRKDFWPKTPYRPPVERHPIE